MKRHIPNSITIGNLLSGCIGIIACLEGSPEFGIWFVLLGGLFDFFDGFAARLLKVQSPIGKELDSLADMVTFGVLPGFIIYALIERIAPEAMNGMKYVSFIIPAFSAIRLAKFNVDTRQSDRFIGLPTPANALFISSIPVILQRFPYLSPMMTSYLLVAIAIGMSLLLVAELPLLALKFKNFSFKDNVIRYVFLLLSLVLLLFLQLAGIPLVILLYVIVSVFNQDKI